jgi:two-component system sensor histidine kinase AlgZ
MTTAIDTLTPPATAPCPQWQHLLATFAAGAGLWTLISAIGALTSLNDDLRRGVQGSFWLILGASARTSVALALLGCAVYACLTRWARWTANARGIVSGYGLLLLLCLPLQLTFVGKLYLQEDGPGLSWSSIASQMEAVDRFAPILHWTSVTAVYFAMVAIKVWQQNQQRSLALAHAQAAALAARLELEEQRGMALRAQLEPHFVFNALNAISAMVRADKEVALTGIQGLSDLLRYALGASERHWVSLGEELNFVDDYLALQRLRYGDRLQIAIDGVSAAVLDCDCPPLLLQPLVENALRHDLDCHEGASDIRLLLERRDGALFIRVTNPVHHGAAHNPGVGLGLRNIGARLQLAYGSAATLQAGMVNGLFEVNIRIPAHAPD